LKKPHIISFTLAVTLTTLFTAQFNVRLSTAWRV